ncbi:sensor histidine kinase [Nocardioides dongxiaopingii]|uniref:sensor histidine kinase n=1 Tax=Nocardioides sp. S-1144 TaxID=2582905 RepID=UPI00110E5880|nr:sensor histidine kinase [Nocardioides sp. S-1144]QCW50503.1 sensor histidine kinase [Nocardioides sp. S-1144]
MTRLAGTVRSPVAQFLAAGLLVLVVLLVVTNALAGRAAREEALSDAGATTEVLARSVAERSLPRGLVTGEPGAVDRFDHQVRTRLVTDQVRRVKIWNREGRIVWSDEARLFGEDFALDEEELDVLDHGGTDAEVSDLAEPENRYERDGGSLVEVYTRIESPEGEPLLFEAYFDADEIQERQAELVAPFRTITVGSLLLVLVLATSLLWVLTRRLTRAAVERERLLVAAADASDAERRRIARDLHDGVVQDLAGTSFALSALARRPGDPAEREQLLDATTSLRSSMRSLRSLLVEIHPPGLGADDLEAALHDLTAGAADLGVEVAISVAGLGGVPDDTVALVWRVAQEATRNALRHARARRLEVTVVRPGAEVVLTVSDDGVGFDPAAAGDGSFGLRGLASLARDHGGRLDVVSSVGSGTTVRLEVGA